MKSIIAAIVASTFTIAALAQAPAKPAEKKDAPKAEVKKDEKKK